MADTAEQERLVAALSASSTVHVWSWAEDAMPSDAAAPLPADAQ
jgi:hypothetical protein